MIKSRLPDFVNGYENLLITFGKTTDDDEDDDEEETQDPIVFEEDDYNKSITGRELFVVKCSPPATKKSITISLDLSSDDDDDIVISSKLFQPKIRRGKR